MRRILVFLLSLSLLLGSAGQARAQSAVQVADVQVSYTFGDQIHFTCRIISTSPIDTVFLFFQSRGDQDTRVIPITPAADGSVEYIHRIQDGPVQPFAWVYFWFRVTLKSGETFDSDHNYFKYEDNRYPWQVLEDNNLRLHWYVGDLAFGQAAFDAAHNGLQKVESVISAEAPGLVDIYIYPSSTDVQNALNLGGYPWVGGHASPDLDTVLVSIAPGPAQRSEMDRQIPHELAHILLYRITGASYNALPSWLVEGIASLSESASNIDYAQVLSIAQKNNSLLSIVGLCGPFPLDTPGAILAYSESESFTRYLRDTYGTSGLDALVRSYADGLTCEQGATRAVGLPLSLLEMQWRQTILGENVRGIAIQNLLPYLFLLIVVLIIPFWGIRLARKGRPDAGQFQ